MNSHLIQTHGSREGVQILVVDATFHEKSGRHTPNQVRFYNGKSGQVETGLEWSVVAVVDVEQNTAYALSPQQTLIGPIRPSFSSRNRASSLWESSRFLFRPSSLLSDLCTQTS